MFATRRKIAFLGALALSVFAVQEAPGQTPCPPPGKTTLTAKLATCAAAQAVRIDSLEKLVKRLSSSSGGSTGGSMPADLEARLQKLELWEAQGRPTMADFYTKLPPDGRTVTEYVASAVSSSSQGGSSAGDLQGISTRIPGELTFRSNLAGRATQSGITDSYHGICGINDWDGGFRCLQNWQLQGTKKLPGGTFGMDSRAAFSYNWWPAAETLNGVQESPDMGPFTNEPGSALYNAYRGQTFIIDGGSQAAYDFSSGAQLYSSRAVLLASQRAGWPIYFAVSPDRANGYPLNRAVMKLDSSWDPNPVLVTLGGTLRRLVPCAGDPEKVCFR